jgi:hypothetical protein
MVAPRTALIQSFWRRANCGKRRIPVDTGVGILTAIATTKIPELSARGFWFMVGNAKTNFAITLSLPFLISVGGGSWPPDALSRSENPR